MEEFLIGRKREQSDLRKWAESERSEFIAIYGRRRVGKTFLVKKTFKGRFDFHFSGSFDASRKEQLLNFGLALRDQTGDHQIPIPENWIMAFHQLKMYLEKCNNHHKIIFLDELPWIDTPKSGFISALENFWNAWASWRTDIKLIVCGSATSWIINKLIRNKGGLHNRLTHSIFLKPFQLSECEAYFDTYGFRYSRKQIAECYMVLGGIPYYFSLMERGESPAQNIDHLFFAEDAPLKDEFENLYRALYKNYKRYVSIVKVLAEKGIGLTRKEILAKTGLENNGEFSKMLEDLELCGFLRSYLPFKPSKNRQVSTKVRPDTLYQLIDFLSLFYLRFNAEQRAGNEKFWSRMINSPRINAWRGISFEMLCLCHINRIKDALGIADVSTHIYSWSGGSDEKKVQIDLLIDRADDTINLCEMKFTKGEFKITKDYARHLEDKIEVLQQVTRYGGNILLTLISANGVERNSYSSMVQREVTLDELF